MITVETIEASARGALDVVERVLARYVERADDGVPPSRGSLIHEIDASRARAPRWARSPVPWGDRLIIAYADGEPRGYAHLAQTTLDERPIVALRFLGFSAEEPEIGRSLLAAVERNASAWSAREIFAFEPWCYERLLFDTRSLSVRAAHVRAVMLEHGYEVSIKYFTHAILLDGAVERAIESPPQGGAWRSRELKVNGPGDVISLEQDGQVLGQVVLRYPAEAPLGEGQNFAFISWIKVEPSLRRSGLGWRLVRKALCVASTAGHSSVRCVVKPDNVAALLMFARLGFTVQDARFDARKKLA